MIKSNIKESRLTSYVNTIDEQLFIKEYATMTCIFTDVMTNFELRESFYQTLRKEIIPFLVKNQELDKGHLFRIYIAMSERKRDPRIIRDKNEMGTFVETILMQELGLQNDMRFKFNITLGSYTDALGRQLLVEGMLNDARFIRKTCGFPIKILFCDHYVLYTQHLQRAMKYNIKYNVKSKHQQKLETKQNLQPLLIFT